VSKVGEAVVVVVVVVRQDERPTWALLFFWRGFSCPATAERVVFFGGAKPGHLSPGQSAWLEGPNQAAVHRLNPPGAPATGDALGSTVPPELD
jgi:hypothetical protein